MELSSYFGDFLPRISQTERQKQLVIEEHIKLRESLMKYPTLKPVLLSTFIQGSQRRFTAIKGSKDHPCDVDVVAVTNLPRNGYTAEYAHSIFEPFLRAHYPGRYKSQDRSWCITVDDEVTMDLVPTSEPDSKALREAVISRKFDWTLDTPRGVKTGAFLQDLSESILEAAQRDRDWDKEEPLWIPDRSVKVWEKTHPLYLIAWTAKKNLACNGHFTHVVKVLKWWRRHMEPLPKYPKGYPLEHVIGECCPDGIKSVAEGVTKTLEEVSRRYALDATLQRTPFLAARGVKDPEVDVMKRVTGADFAGFHANVRSAALHARAALDNADNRQSALLWGKLLGTEFPAPPEERAQANGGYKSPAAAARPEEGRFA